MINNYPNSFHFNSGDSIFFARPIIPSDKYLFKLGYKELSESSRYFRFFVNREKLNEFQLKFLTEIDGVNHIAWGIIDETEELKKPVAVGRLIRIVDEPHIAEIAITVVDSYQKLGIGRVLFTLLNIAASKIEISIIRYYVLYNNRFVLNHLKKLGIVNQKKDGSVIILDAKIHNQTFSIPENFDLDNIISEIKKIDIKSS